MAMTFLDNLNAPLQLITITENWLCFIDTVEATSVTKTEQCDQYHNTAFNQSDVDSD